MMSTSSWEIQDDRFDDVDSENDDKLSAYEDDLYIDGLLYINSIFFTLLLDY